MIMTYQWLNLNLRDIGFSRNHVDSIPGNVYLLNVVEVEVEVLCRNHLTELEVFFVINLKFPVTFCIQHTYKVTYLKSRIL